MTKSKSHTAGKAKRSGLTSSGTANSNTLPTFLRVQDIDNFTKPEDLVGGNCVQNTKHVLVVSDLQANLNGEGQLRARVVEEPAVFESPQQVHQE